MSRVNGTASQHRPGKSQSCLSSCLVEILMALIVIGLVLLMLATVVKPDFPFSAGCQVNPSYPQKVFRWCGLITHYAEETGLEPDLVAALILQESGGSSEIISHSGAVGLMQVMPRDGLAAKFVCRGQPCFSDRPTSRELRDPAFNIQYGTQLLRNLIEFYNGDMREALRAYGPMDVGYHYADTVIALYYRYSPVSQK